MTDTLQATAPPAEAEFWSAERLDEINARLAGTDPQATLEWAIDTFGHDVALACSFGGVSGMALLDMVMRIDPRVPVFYIDTDVLFPETYATRDRAAGRYGFRPLAFTAELTLAEQAERHGEALWARDPDACCAIRKVAPNQRALEGRRAWISGLRRDQSETRREIRRVEWDAKFGLVKINPLVDWTEKQVWAYVVANDVPYNPLHDRGYPSIGCTHCTRPVAPGEDPRAGRWSGFGKTECGLHVQEDEAKA
jgi:phosphoadenosine phosphosulfate reductase